MSILVKICDSDGFIPVENSYSIAVIGIFLVGKISSLEDCKNYTILSQNVCIIGSIEQIK